MLCPRQLPPLLAERAYAPIPFSYVYMYRLQLLSASYSSAFPAEEEDEGEEKRGQAPAQRSTYISARIFVGVEMTREGCGDIQCAPSIFTRGLSRAHVVGQSREVEDARKSVRNLPGNSVPKIAPSIS